MKELILGAGNRTGKLLTASDSFEYHNPVRLDIDPVCNPDILWNLDDLPLPFEDAEFDEIHAYEVLEHLGEQGNWRKFFTEFSEYYRILKPGGLLFASVPMWNNLWAWGDPGHRRVINRGTLVFLDPAMYEEGVGKTAMTDYRHYYTGSFKPVSIEETEDTFFFILRKS